MICLPGYFKVNQVKWFRDCADQDQAWQMSGPNLPVLLQVQVQWHMPIRRSACIMTWQRSAQRPMVLCRRMLVILCPSRWDEMG